MPQVLEAHGHESTKCPMRGRRVPEIAAGDMQKFFDEVTQKELAAFVMEHASGPGLTEHQRTSLTIDWESGKCRIALSMKLKLDAFQVLPLRLAGIGHCDERIARISAAACVAQYQRATEVQRRGMHWIT